MSMSESDFRRESDAALERLNRDLDKYADQYDAEVMLQNGVLTIEVEEPAPGKIVISPNAAVRQIWISALSRSFKLEWSGSAFVLGATGENLDVLVTRLVEEQLGM
jgi:iron donor protein CyaY